MHSTLQIKDNTIKDLSSALETNIFQTWEHSDNQPTIQVSVPGSMSPGSDSEVFNTSYFENYTTFLNT